MIMQALEKYITNTLGIDINIIPLPEREQKNIPLYLRSIYNFRTLQIFKRDILFLKQKQNEYLTAEQYRKHTQIVENALNLPAVLIIEPIEPYNRKRLIEKQVAFIIIDKQMFIPQLLIDLKDFRYKTQKRKNEIQPAAQCLLLYHLQKENLEKMNFKEIAAKLNYTPMTITRAANEFSHTKICHIDGTKDKRIIFEKDKKALWEMASPYMQTPVKRKIFIDEYIKEDLLYKTNFSALSFYTNISEDQNVCYAISKFDYFYLKKHKQINITNKIEGHTCLEIWKYAPAILANDGIVDPLSLYLTFKDSNDERIAKEIEGMIESLW
jgi:hypothetical protein